VTVGSDIRSLFSYVDLEARVPQRHPLRLIRTIVNEVLVSLDAEFERLYEGHGRESIAPVPRPLPKCPSMIPKGLSSLPITDARKAAIPLRRCGQRSQNFAPVWVHNRRSLSPACGDQGGQSMVEHSFPQPVMNIESETVEERLQRRARTWIGSLRCLRRCLRSDRRRCFRSARARISIDMCKQMLEIPLTAAADCLSGQKRCTQSNE
jgi:hypothetical protein